MAHSATAISPPLAPEASSWAPERALFELDPAVRRHARERRVARDLVELSRLQRGAETADCAPADLARLVGAIACDSPQLDVDGPPCVLITTDSRRLARILFALIDNAKIHGGPPVSLRYDETAIVVRDHGSGFAASMLTHATEPFVIGDRVGGRGIGLGLAIASGQAALLGAELVLANHPDGGANVAVVFRTPPSVAA